MKTINEIIEKRISVNDFKDSEIMALAYGIEFFSTYAAQTPAEGATWWAENRPMYAARLEEATARSPQREGQLWEECEKCGDEPSYMPLHLCANCWAGGAK